MNKSIDGFIFDLDGTVYLGEEAISGAVETIQHLRNLGKKTLFVSNKPLQPRTAYAKKLSQLGILTYPDDVITSGYVMGYHLALYEPDLRLYVIGEQALHDELRSHGLTILDEFANQDEKSVIQPHQVDAVIVAFDRTLDYRKLNTAFQALVNGAKFYATNADKTCPMPGGGIPDAGGTIAALEHMTGRKLELVAGKPSQLIIDVALRKLDLPPERCLMVGDRLETDIHMGQQAGMVTAVVLTGASTAAQAHSHKPPPSYVLNTIADIPQAVLQ